MAEVRLNPCACSRQVWCKRKHSAFWLHGLMEMTVPCQGTSRGSIPRGAAYAVVVKLADTLASRASVRKDMWVRLPPSAPWKG